MVDRVLRRGRRFYTPARGAAFMPVEFQTGTYRMGHSMVRPSYRANLAGDNGQPFFAFIFDPSQEGRPDPDDLRGGARAPRRFIGWQTFFDFGDGQVKPNKRIDTKISTRAVSPALGRDRQPRRADGAGAAQPPAPPHLAAALRPERRPRDAASPRSPAPTCRSSPTSASASSAARRSGTTSSRKPRSSPTACSSGRSADASSPKCSSACCRPTKAPTWRPNRAGGPRCRPRAATFRMTDFLTFAGVDPQSRGQ